ncbi:MAG TPA: hypothetical protein VGF85_13385 [Opitutaceae bacterium]|jgi:hypothetical protein
MNLRSILTLSLAAVAALQPTARADDEAVAIASQKSADYVRERLPDGSFKPETFAFADGGVWRGAEGATKDDVDFMDVARTIARPLESEGYVATRDPNNTRLLIVVYWGTTQTPDHPTDSVGSERLQIANAAALSANHPQAVPSRPNDGWGWSPAQLAQGATIGYAIRSPDQIDADNAFTGALAEVAAENAKRDHVDLENAKVLGFDTVWTPSSDERGTALEQRQEDLVGEIESPRYFVVLMAYDFRMLWKEKHPKLLWETRFSIREQGDTISDHLAGMAQAARTYFGRNSGSLVRAPLPDGHVRVGPLKELASDVSEKSR